MTGRSRGLLALAGAVSLLVTGLVAVEVTGPGSSAARPPAPAAGQASSTAAGPAPDGALTSGDLLPTSPPTRVRIPALDVDAAVTGLGLEADGTMQVPADAATVGWYTRAPTPGSLGPAVLAGHVDYRGREGTFAGLSKLRRTDRIEVTRTDGVTAVFEVTETGRYPKDRFPSDAVYGPIDHAGLRLITCGGDFDSRSGHYADNVVVFAALRTTSAGG
jgi:hypothetical protein